MEIGNCFKPPIGFRQSNLGITKTPQSKRIHPSWSTLLDIEKASAERVDLTTLEIFLDVQISGEMGACSLSLSFWSVAHMMVPWWDDNCLGLANDASPKETCDTSETGMCRKQIFTCANSWASLKTLLAAINVATVPRDIWDWISPNLAAMSGLVWVTAYCRLPTNQSTQFSQFCFMNKFIRSLSSLATDINGRNCMDVILLIGRDTKVWQLF